MKYYKIEGMETPISAIAMGCMRIGELEVQQLEALIETALKLGINFFDHADIYAGGASEILFGKVLKKRPEFRSQMIIQTKCGIRDGYYDFSKEHILYSVDKSLKQLQINQIDILLLHRPDALMNPEEVAMAFDMLYDAGKVKAFGVSNMTPGQIALIQRFTKHKLYFNQLQFNLVNATMIDSGIHANMQVDASIDRDGGVLDYCRLNNITIQCWSILQASWTEGSYLNHPDYAVLNENLTAIAEKYGVSQAAIATAWILRHPAKMQAIAGTTSVQNLEDLCMSTSVELTREEWYKLYLSASPLGKKLP